MNAKILSGANLAFIGDAYYELYIRHHLIKKGINNLDNLHKETLKYVSRTSQTIYKDLNGNEIEVNDGNTFFNICPINSNVTFE